KYPRDLDLAILRTNKMLYREAIDVLYNTDEFSVSIFGSYHYGIGDVEQRFGIAAVKKVARVSLWFDVDDCKTLMRADTEPIAQLISPKSLELVLYSLVGIKDSKALFHHHADALTAVPAILLEHVKPEVSM
ncbi:hypothetical protein LTS18_009336, partial [Coniosporium uncinatum]